MASTNTIDELMDRIDLSIAEGGIPSKTDIDAVIAYQRKMRANAEAGIKPKKGDSGREVTLSLEQLGLGQEKPKISISRRSLK